MKEGAVTAAERFPALALRPFPRASASDPGQGFEANRDRILITLLALDLMLMAFFVVLNSTATFDSKPGAEIASGSSAAASAAVDPAPVEKTAPASDAPGMGTAVRIAAAAELRAAVAEVFESFLPAGAAAAADAEDGRVDVDIPADAAGADELPPAVIAGLAHVMENAPAGYRTELVIQTREEPAANLARLARLAQDLVGRGVPAAALSVGTTTGRSSPGLHFTFLLLEPGEESRAARLAGKTRS